MKKALLRSPTIVLCAITLIVAAAGFVIAGNTHLTGLVLQAGDDGTGGDLQVNGNTTLGDSSADTVTITGTPTFGTSIVLEGATADAFETTLSVTDPTVDQGFRFPNNTTLNGLAQPSGATYNVFYSTVATTTDAANAVWGVANGFQFEGATANDIEMFLVAADPTVADATITIPNTAGVADTVALLTLAQTFVGAKTFSAGIVANSGISSAAATDITITTGTTGILNLFTGTSGGINIGTDAGGAKNILIGTNDDTLTSRVPLNITPVGANEDTLTIGTTTGGGAAFTGNLTALDLTAARTWNLPNTTGGLVVDTTTAGIVSGVNGTAGATFTLGTGAGGTATTGTAGVGGPYSLSTAAGGAANGAAGIGGAGGAFSLTLGNGGASSDVAGGNSGAGGGLTFTTGTGGLSTAGTGGVGGSVLYTVGTGGGGTAGAGGVGGAFTINTGAAGASGAGGANGGAFSVTTGAGTGTGVQGNVLINGLNLDVTATGISIHSTTTPATDDTLALAVTTGGAGTFTGTLTNGANDLTAARTYTLKDASGTVAFLTDISGYNAGEVTIPGEADDAITGDVAGKSVVQLTAGAADFAFALTLTNPVIGQVVWIKNTSGFTMETINGANVTDLVNGQTRPFIFDGALVPHSAATAIVND